MARRLNSKFPRAPRVCRPRTYRPSNGRLIQPSLSQLLHFTKIQNGRPASTRGARSAFDLTLPPYCLSYTTTLFTSRPCASLPLNTEVRVFPSLETVDLTVITTWPAFFILVSTVLLSMRFTDTVSALGTPVTG